MSRHVTISPAAGRRVRHPDGRLLTPDSRVERSAYWLRRVQAGDIIFSKGRKGARAASGNEELS